jgi:hypothetical protein
MIRQGAEIMGEQFELVAQRNRLVKCLQTVFDFLAKLFKIAFTPTKVDERTKPRLQALSIPLDIVFSILTLAEYLRVMFTEFFVLKVGVSDLINPSPSLGFKNLMIARGWCPSRLHDIPNSYCLLYFTGMLSSFDEREHSGGCSFYFCKMLPKLVESYRPSHDMENCSGECGNVEVDVHELDDILQSGSYPAVILSEDIRGGNLKLMDVSGGQPYIAVSHVW